jgi:hypothetical protein
VQEPQSLQVAEQLQLKQLTEFNIEYILFYLERLTLLFQTQATLEKLKFLLLQVVAEAVGMLAAVVAVVEFSTQLTMRLLKQPML